jgi:hypothetical protein
MGRVTALHPAAATTRSHLPMTKRRAPLTDEQREQRRAQQRELVLASIEQLRTSDGWQAYLKTRARFPNYSWRNVLLILHQKTVSHCLLSRSGMDIRSSGGAIALHVALRWLIGRIA